MTIYADEITPGDKDNLISIVSASNQGHESLVMKQLPRSIQETIDFILLFSENDTVSIGSGKTVLTLKKWTNEVGGVFVKASSPIDSVGKPYFQ